MVVGTSNGRQIKSAFQAFYFVVFLIANVQVSMTLGGGGNPIKAKLTELLQILSNTDFSSDFLTVAWVLNVIFWLFAAVFSLHLVRIYITLELMEEPDGGFEKFFDSYPRNARILDFVTRCLIVALVTLKVFKPISFASFLDFFCLFYFTLTLWGLVACLAGKRPVRECFLISSLSGLVVAACLRFLAWNWMLLALILVAATVALGCDLVLTKKGSIFHYGRIFLCKWRDGWAGDAGNPGL
jgi:hypothetical protein